MPVSKSVGVRSRCTRLKADMRLDGLVVAYGAGGGEGEQEVGVGGAGKVALQAPVATGACRSGQDVFSRVSVEGADECAHGACDPVQRRKIDQVALTTLKLLIRSCAVVVESLSKA